MGPLSHSLFTHLMVAIGRSLLQSILPGRLTGKLSRVIIVIDQITGEQYGSFIAAAATFHL